MKSIRNKTPRPIKVTLPGGKTLHLGPAKAGQVSDQTLDLPSFKKLLDSGAIEILDQTGSGATGGGEPSPVHESTHGHAQTKIVLPKGNR